MNIKRRQALEEKAKSKGKILLIENCQLNILPNQIETLKEVLTESVDGKQYKARHIIRNVPVSKYTENLNGRIYPRALDEKIIKEGIAEGTLSLADHPGDDEDGSILNICGVWHNPKLGEHCSYGDWYLVGDNGDLIKETIEAGGSIGVSRVGFGEFLQDEKTVDPDSYDLQRWGDAVINPSQQVFATYENLEQAPNSETDKKNDELSETKEATITNNKEKNIQSLKEAIEDSNINENEGKKHMEKFQESTLRNSIKEAIRMARKNENLKEAIETLRDIEVPVELKDLSERVDSTVVELQGKLEEQKKTAEGKVVELSAKVIENENALKTLNEKYSKAKAIIEKVGLDESVNVDELKENVKKMSEEVSSLKENETEMLKDITAVEKLFEHKLAKKLEITKLSEMTDLMEDTLKRDSDINYLKEKSKKFKESLAKAEKRIKIYEQMLIKRGFKFEEEMDSSEEKRQDYPKENKAAATIASGSNSLAEDEDIDAMTPEEEVIEEELGNMDSDEKIAEEDEEVMGIDGDGDEEPITEDDEMTDELPDEITEDEDENGQTITDDGQIEDKVPNGLDEDEDIDAINPDEEIIEEDFDQVNEDPDAVVADSETLNEDDEVVNDEEMIAEPGRKAESVRRYQFSYNHGEKRIIRNSDPRPSKKQPLAEKTYVNAFVAREMKKNPAIKDIKKYLLESKTLKEAVAKLMRFESKSKVKTQDGMKIKKFSESKKSEKPAWLQGRK
jgi:hypothetical protein